MIEMHMREGHKFEGAQVKIQLCQLLGESPFQSHLHARFSLPSLRLRKTGGQPSVPQQAALGVLDHVTGNRKLSNVRLVVGNAKALDTG